MKYIFRKEKMLQRLEKEGRLDEIDATSKEIMEVIDGYIVEENRFRKLVYGDNQGFIKTENFGTLPVNLADCEETYHD